MDQRQSQEQFLVEDATVEQRWQALSLNIQSCYERLAQASGEEVVCEDGMMWTDKHITISSIDALKINQSIEHALEWYRGRQPVRGALCWYLAGSSPANLEARLFARGFEPNWQPHWMWCELRHLKERYPQPANLTIRIVGDEPAWRVDDLPYYNAREVAALAILARTQPRRVWHLAAFQEQQIVGRCMLNVTTGERGIAGLFSMGVVPAARKQGIGTALSLVACELARQLGCRHVVLNATPMGKPVYRRAGFQSMGYGHTWVLSERVLAAPALTHEQVRFLEAIGRGDISTLDATITHLDHRLLHEPSANGLTPLDIAVRCQQPRSAAWLVAHGVRLDLLSAWDLGWKEQLPALLAERPALVNLQGGQWHATPLQIAIQRDDRELAQLLLTVPNDLTLKDAVFGATAADWAQHFQRSGIIELIEQHTALQQE